MCRHTPTGTMSTMSPPPPDARLSHRMHLLLSTAQHRRLTDRARASGRSVSSLIREAIDRDLGRAPATAVTSGAATAAQRFISAGSIGGDDR